MNLLSVSLLILLLLLFLILSLLIFLIVKMLKDFSREKKEVDLAQTQLLSKALALLASKDPLAYQAIQAMDPTLSNSLSSEEESEIKNEIERSIDDLLHDAQFSPENLTERERERINDFVREADADQFIR